MMISHKWAFLQESPNAHPRPSTHTLQIVLPSGPLLTVRKPGTLPLLPLLVPLADPPLFAGVPLAPFCSPPFDEEDPPDVGCHCHIQRPTAKWSADLMISSR
eukprot:451603-Karenia_brevis.AAC.1